MSKFEVGDVVRVKCKLGGYNVGVEDMRKYCGGTFVVKENMVLCNEDGYILKDCNGEHTDISGYRFATESLELYIGKYKPGDRVIAVDNIHQYPDGAVGTIVDVYSADPIEGNNDYNVKFDLGGRYWSNVLCLAEQPVIVITCDGKTTTATLRDGKHVLKRESVSLYHKDTFDHFTGAEYALKKLFDKPLDEPKFYNGKVVCTKSNSKWWTVGKIYTFENGATVDNSGITRPADGERFENFHEFWKWAKFCAHEADFVELVD